MQEWLFLLQNL